MIGTSLLFSGSIGGLISPFDTITPTAGYSLRNLTLSYNGDVVLVRRDSDSAFQAFKAKEITNGTLSNFLTTLGSTIHAQQLAINLVPDVSLVCSCDSGSAGILEAHDVLYIDGFVFAWYNQFSSNHATQATVASQPKIWDSITGLVTEGGRPALDFDGVDDFLEVPSSTGSFNYLHDGTTSAVFGVFTFGKVSNPDTVYSLTGNNGGTNSKVGAFIAYDDRSGSSRNDANFVYITAGGGNSVSNDLTNDIIIATEQKLMSYFIDADNATASLRTQTGIDGGVLFGNNTDTNAPVTSDATHNLQIGASGANAATLTGYVQELIFYNTDQSANRQDIENNINTYYVVVVYNVFRYRQRVADDSGTFAIVNRDKTVYNSVTTPEMPLLICSCDAYKATKLYNINPT